MTAWDLRLGFLGFLTTCAQAALLRKGLAALSGNELGLALGLFSWLLWTSFGALLFRARAASSPSPGPVFIRLLLVLVLLFPLSLFLFDLLRPLAGVPVGMAPGAALVALGYILLLAPFGLVNGVAFSFGAAAGGGASRAFASESLGGAAGGIFYYLVVILIPFPPAALFPVGFAGILLGVLLLLASPAETPGMLVGKRAVPLPLAALSFSLLILLWIGGRLAENVRWKGFVPILRQETPSGSLLWARPQGMEREEKGGQTVLFYDGSPLIAYPDPRTAEEAVQPALILHQFPRRVLLLTDRATEIVDQVLAHPVERLTVALLDPEMLASEEKVIPGLGRTLADPRVAFIPKDPRRVLAEAGPGSYDVVLVSLPDPATFQFNRFYTREFFALARKALAEDGLFSFSLGEPGNYISPLEAEALAAVDGALAPLFPHRTWHPLSRYVVTAGSRSTPLSASTADRVAAARSLRLRFVRGEYLRSSLSEDRMEEVRTAMEGAFTREGPRSNRDQTPSAVGYHLALWEQRQGGIGVFWFLQAGLSLSWTFLAGFLLLALSSFLPGSSRSRSLFLPILGGFSGMAAEVTLLFLYQAAYGALYARISLFLGTFMAGAAAGTLLPAGGRRSWMPPLLWAVYSGLLAAAAVLPLPGALPAWLGRAFLVLLMAIAGVLTGWTFQAANQTLAESGMRSPAGVTYGLDLSGAALAAYLGLLVPLAAGFAHLPLLALFFALALAVGAALRSVLPRYGK